MLLSLCGGWGGWVGWGWQSHFRVQPNHCVEVVLHCVVVVTISINCISVNLSTVFLSIYSTSTVYIYTYLLYICSCFPNLFTLVVVQTMI